MDRCIVRVALIGVAWIGAIGAPSPARAAGWAHGLFAEVAHDFGPVPRGARVRHNFVVTNRLTEPVTILNVRASCGCTTGLATNLPILPGQAAPVEALMDTTNFTGRKETTLFVTVRTASGSEAEVRLAVASTILSDIVLNPGTIDFGATVASPSPKRTLTIDRLGAPEWKALRMISASRAIDASLAETHRTAAGVGYALTVTLKPDAPAGPLREEIRILTNDRGSPSIPVLVTGLVRGAGLTASPAILTLGPADSQARVLVRGPRPFRITGIEGTGDGFEVAGIDASSRPAHVLTVRFRRPAGGAKGEARKTLRILTDLAGEPPLELKATARGE